MDEIITTEEMESISFMWFVLSGDAARRGDDASADEFWHEAVVWHNNALAQESF